ncbi:hypothetical protein SK128_007421 [Halocaridina rubra]|uniref:B30.2/SPRY domain-containing protein n=1 Tax=Halocaridina rubra TaxID=373956 RepID=A0AAN8X4P3_HALRR
MNRQYMPQWPPGPGQYASPGQGQYPPSGPGQYPPVIKEEPDFAKMGYEDGPLGGYSIKREPGIGYNEQPPMGIAPNIKQELPEVKQEIVEPKQEPTEERRGEKRQAQSHHGSADVKRYRPEEGGHVEDEPEYDKNAVLLDWYNSDLSLNISKDDFLSATPLSGKGFAYVWHGVRATYGFHRGRVFYEVKVVDYTEVSESIMENEQHPHVLRCGWSVDDASLTLGEEPLSYGYGGTAKASTNLKFKDYGRTFGKGDVIGSFLDMDSEPIVMSFSLNGRNLGMCYEVSHRALQGRALFPHILTKNCIFRVNFGTEYPWFQPLTRYTFVGQVPLLERTMGSQGPATRQDSEALMMIGLPACGKTTWVEKYCKEHLDKKFYVLGTNFLIDKMKVNGLPRKGNYHGRWDQLISDCTQCLNTLLEKSYKRRRNFIIDQTNVYASARRRKMKGFNGFCRRAVVVCPTDAEFQKRTSMQVTKEGKNVPEHAILEMKANFTLPEGEEDLFDSVEYVELPHEQASQLVEKYSREAQNAGYVKKNNNRGGGRGRGNFRGGWDRDQRGGSNVRSDRGGFGDRGGRGGFTDRGFNSRSDQGRFNDRGGFGDRSGRGGFAGGERGGFNERSSRGGYNDRGSSFNQDNASGGGSRGGFGGRDRDRFGRDAGTDRHSDNVHRVSRFDDRGSFSRGGNRDGPGAEYGTDRDSRGSDSPHGRGDFGRGGPGSSFVGMERDNRFGDGPNNSPHNRGGYGQGGFNRDGPQSYSSDNVRSGDSGRFDRDRRGGGNSYGKDGSYDVQGGHGNSSRGFSTDRDHNSRESYSGSSFSSFDSPMRSMGSSWGVYSSPEYGSGSESSGYRSQSSDRGSMGSVSSGQSYSSDWSRQSGQQQPWGQNNSGSGGPSGSDYYGRPSDRDGGGSWDQQRRGGRGGPWGGGPASGNPQWNYDSGYRGERP